MDTFLQFVSNPNNYPLLSQVFSFFNLILLLLTATISFFSWRSARRANELQLLPLLAIYFCGKQSRDRTIKIRNIGKSPAYDIKIESFTYIITDIHSIWKLDLSISGTNVVAPDEEKNLTIKGTTNGKESDNINDFLVFHLDPEEDHKRSRADLILTFRNARGDHYYAKVNTGRDGLFIGPIKKINIMESLFLQLRKYQEKALLIRYGLYWRFTKPHIAQPH